MNSVRDRMTEWLIRDVVARYVYILHMPTAAYFRLKFRRGFVALIGSYIEIIDTKDTQRSTFELIQWHFEFNRRTRRNRIRLGSVRTFLAVWSCSESFACGTAANSYYFLIAYPFEYVSFIYVLRLSILLCLFLLLLGEHLGCVDECLCQCGLSEMYMLFTADNLRIGSIDVHTNYDRSIFVFRLDEPVRQSRVRWVPYHCYISVAISLRNICWKFCLPKGESILKTRFLFPLWYFRNYSKFYYLFSLS